MRRPRLGHLTTVDLSLTTLLRTELEVDLAAGFEVFAISAPGTGLDELTALGVRHVPIPSFTRAWSLAGDLRAARELATALRGLHLDVLHTHTPKAGVLGRVLGRALGIEVVVNTCHGLWAQPSDGLRRRAAVLAVEGLAARCSHAELYQNSEDHHALRWAVPRSRSQVVGNGTDLDRFRFDPRGREAIRRELGLGDDELLVGGVGRQVAEKGLREFVTAAGSLGDRATFVWVGPADPDKPDAFDHDRGAVRFVGMRDDLPSWYAAFDVFVLPSYREGFSRSAMEAASCATAMVLSDIRGCREIGEDGEHVLLVPPRDPSALITAIGRLLDDPGLRERLAAAARTRAHQHFDQRRVAAASIATYAAVSTRRDSPSRDLLAARSDAVQALLSDAVRASVTVTEA